MKKTIDDYASMYRSNDTSPWEHAVTPHTTQKIYLVWYITPSYQDVIAGVFTTREKADKFIINTSDMHNYSIQEVEVDE